MDAHYQTDQVTLYHGDCLEVMRELADESVHAVVTDPPYGLGFMGRAWDALPPGEEFAREALRVLKPGGHMLAFGGSRTWHRLAVAIEDAGFEIRDSIAWLYGSGFPKSMDVAQAIDKLDAADARLARAREFQTWLREHLSPQRVNELTGTDMGHHLTTHPTHPTVATAELLDRLRPELPDVPERIEELVAERAVESVNYAARQVVGAYRTGVSRGAAGVTAAGDGKARTASHTEEARTWEGWGTALKPAFEPIVVARKPLAGTVAANVLAHGTGALNIDACRVGTSGGGNACPGGELCKCITDGVSYSPTKHPVRREGEFGRWPTNVVLDDTQAAALDEQTGVSVSRAGKPRGADAGDGWGMTKTDAEYSDEGGASRFFPVFRFEAKAPSSERPNVDGVQHPTVKPLALMRWLCRLVTPRGGVILEPFAGSGTTLEAAILEGFDVVGIEREADYLPLIISRVRKDHAVVMDLWGGVAS